MLRVPPKFNADFISSIFYPEEYRNDNLRSINWGRCYDWAYYAYRTFHSSEIELYSTVSHAYVKHEGKFYDSEAHDGVDEWYQLRTNAFWRGDPVKQDLATFTQFWDGIGAGHRYHWDSMLEDNLQKTLGFAYVPKEKPTFLDPFLALPMKELSLSA